MFNNRNNFNKYSDNRYYNNNYKNNNYYKNKNKRKFNSNKRNETNKRLKDEVNYELTQMLNNFNNNCEQTINNTINEKPKYDTIAIELNEKLIKGLTEDILRNELKIYGSVKKVWFNSDKSKVFISFYNSLSVDMIVENGKQLVVNELPLTVSPLKVVVPQELECNGNQRLSIRSDNSSLRAVFPVMDSLKRKSNSRPVYVNIDEMYGWVKNERIDSKPFQFSLHSQIRKSDTIGEQIKILFDNILLKPIDNENRINIRDKLQEILFLNDFPTVIHFLGSTVNKLGFRDSDMDLYIEFDPKLYPKVRPQSEGLEYQDSFAILSRVQRLLKTSLKFNIPTIPSSRCPIIKLDFKNMSPNLKYDGIVCDLSLNNGLGVHNSKLIQVLCDFEPRFQELCVILRYWAKMNGFVGQNEFSSYAFTQMVIFFCQNTSPAILPTIDYLKQLTSDSRLISGWDCNFTQDMSLIKLDEHNDQPIHELLKQFFKYYSSFDFTTQVIRTKTGLSEHKIAFIPKTETIDKLKQFKLTSICCIEDPFELTHNLTGNLNYKLFHKFVEYLKYITINSETIFNVIKDECDSPYNKPNEWGISHIITKFDPTPHGYVFPDHFIGFANIDLILNKTESLLTISDIIKTLVNNLSETMFELLNYVYEIETLLCGKWDVVMGEISPFAEFYIKVRGIDFEVIDSMTRDNTVNELSDEEFDDNLDFFKREKLITRKIKDQYRSSSFTSIVPVHCHFALIIHSLISFPTVELAFVEVKPDYETGRDVIMFLKRLIASAANHQRLLTVRHDLI